MHRAVDDGVFPGAVLLVAANRRILWHAPYGVTDLSDRRPVGTDTVFDLASLTKPLATTLAVMRLVADGRLGLDATLDTLLCDFAGTDKAAVTVRHLLAHTAGLPDYRPYYKVLIHVPENRRADALTELLAGEPRVGAVGETTCYSDLGFMILARIVERIGGLRLDRFVDHSIYRPLGITDLFFVDLAAERPQRVFAGTEQCPWRRRPLAGEVHDDNAWAVGGIDGQAGLFGTATAVHRLLDVLLAHYLGQAARPLFPRELVRTFFRRTAADGRALGFDVPSAEGSSSGACFSPDSVGHLGFTGTSFWMDLQRQIVVVLLTNRVHPSRENLRIKKFRPQLHDRVMAQLNVCPPAG